MSLGNLVILGGVSIGLLGFVAEAVAMVAIASYRLRRRLPFQSPIQLQGWGCWAITGGVGLIIVGQFLRSSLP